MVVSFTTLEDTTPSEVVYWGPDDGAVRRATGSMDAYSQILWVERGLMEPRMGAPGITAEEVLQRQNTASFASAISVFPYTRAANYENRSQPKLKLGEYKNPQVRPVPTICRLSPDARQTGSARPLGVRS